MIDICTKVCTARYGKRFEGKMSDEAALLAEIARLSGAIDQQRSFGSGSTSYETRPAYQPRGRGGRGSGYGAPGSSRGGRGGFGRGYTAPYPSSGAPIPRPSRHRTLVLNKLNGNDAQQQPPPEPKAPEDLEDGEIDPASAEAKPQTWVKRKTTHNMSLVRGETFEKT